MLKNLMSPGALVPRIEIRVPRELWTDLLLMALLVGLDAVALLVPHAPNFTPVAASALFAASLLRTRAFSVVVPIAGLMLGDAVHGYDDWRVMMVVYGALALPAFAACVSRRLRAPAHDRAGHGVVIVAFFLLSNFAVWAFSPLYAPNLGGVVTCYGAALPFLKYTIAGDLFWAAVLFGGYWLIQNIHAADMRALKPAVVEVRRDFGC